MKSGNGWNPLLWSRAEPSVEGRIGQKNPFGVLDPGRAPADELLQWTFVKGDRIVGRVLDCQRRSGTAHQSIHVLHRHGIKAADPVPGF